VFGINGPEFLLLLLIGILVIGPQRLPEYTQKLTNLVREVRRIARVSPALGEARRAGTMIYSWRDRLPRTSEIV
jgi:Sec-independent protein translocase protein TatA